MLLLLLLLLLWLLLLLKPQTRLYFLLFLISRVKSSFFNSITGKKINFFWLTAHVRLSRERVETQKKKYPPPKKKKKTKDESKEGWAAAFTESRLECKNISIIKKKAQHFTGNNVPIIQSGTPFFLLGDIFIGNSFLFSFFCESNSRVESVAFDH